MVLLIRDQDIREVEISAEEIIEAVEDAYHQEGMGVAEDTPRIEIKIKGKELPHIAPGTTSVGQGMAYLKGSKAFVISHSYHFSWHRYVSHILDPEEGETLAIVVRGRELSSSKRGELNTGSLRTGAAAAIGAKYLARKDVNSVGVLGTGRIGRASLVCLSKVRDFDKAYVHSGKRRNDEFARDMGLTLGIDVIAADNAMRVVRESDILITATYATEPIVRGKWLKEGVHISGMGADGPLKCELDLDAISRMDKIVIDSEKCLSIGEISNAIESGVLRADGIHGKISEVVAGAKSGRENPNEITLFESDGTHIQSASVVWLIYEKIKQAGLGIETSDLSSFFLYP